MGSRPESSELGQSLPTLACQSRILIVGISGAGKTHVARRVAALVPLPVTHLDQIFWLPGWSERDPRQVSSMVAELIAEPRWILEGFVEPLGRQRVERADLVIFLDPPGILAAVRVVRRWWKHRHRARPELSAGDAEHFSWSFVMTVLRRRERPEILAALDDGSHAVLRFRRAREVERFLARARRTGH